MGKKKERLNQMIRQRIPGGDLLLDALPVLRVAADRPGSGRPPAEVLAIRQAFNRLDGLVNGLRDAFVKIGQPPIASAVKRMPHDEDDSGPMTTRRAAPVVATPPVQDDPPKAPAQAVRHFAAELPDSRRQHTGIGVVWHPPAAVVSRMGKEADAAIAKEAGVSETAVREARARLNIKPFLPRWSGADDAVVLSMPTARAAEVLGRSVASVKTRKTRLKAKDGK